MRLARTVLEVKSLEASRAFYRDRLGMRVIAEQRGIVDGEDEMRLVLGFEATGTQAALELVHRKRWTNDPAIAHRPTSKDRYWKIGMTLPQVDLARDRLVESGVPVSAPEQFRDIGYLCHLADPDGYVIELLQHRFAANHRPSPPDPSFTLGSRPTLGQVSLRVADAEASLAFYVDTLGLRLLSRQMVDPPGFTLYFLADTDDQPPDPDPDAVLNREWLWQRPYTTLELQYRWAASNVPPATASDRTLGFVELCFAASSGKPTAETERVLHDPDGNRLRITDGG